MTESATFLDRDAGITECHYVRDGGFEVLTGGTSRDDALTFARELAAQYDKIQARIAAGEPIVPPVCHCFDCEQRRLAITQTPG